MSLSVLLDYRPEDTKVFFSSFFTRIFKICKKNSRRHFFLFRIFFQEHSFEVSLFAELFNEMLMRDFGFRIYRSLSILPEKPKDKEDDKKKDKKEERRDDKKDDKRKDEENKKCNKKDDKKRENSKDKKEDKDARNKNEEKDKHEEDDDDDEEESEVGILQICQYIIHNVPIFMVQKIQLVKLKISNFSIILMEILNQNSFLP